jgi:hypothetical protein
LFSIRDSAVATLHPRNSAEEKQRRLESAPKKIEDMIEDLSALPASSICMANKQKKKEQKERMGMQQKRKTKNRDGACGA